MTKSYTDVVKQIEVLKVEAEKLRKREIAGVIKRIREAVQFYNLTASDLGLGAAGGTGGGTASAPAKATRKSSGGSKGSKATKPAKAVRAVKFRDENGNTWGGVGKRPQWLRDALAAGKTLKDFAVQ